MSKVEKMDYSALDRPEALFYIFHPRPEPGFSKTASGCIDVMVPVGDNESVGGRFHPGDREAPNLLFFHGNGEIVSDYDPMGPLFKKNGINFFPVDYSGYGRSTGSPSVAAAIKDSHAILDFALKWLPDNHFTGSVFVMGRSLGSACALELAANRPESVEGLVIESGFAFTGPLLQVLGVNLNILGFEENMGFNNLEKIKAHDGPLLVIHAENDHIIPFSDGQALYDASPSKNKTLLKIPGADHNDIFLHGFHEYMANVKKLVASVARTN